jgi:hypothetical protein
LVPDSIDFQNERYSRKSMYSKLGMVLDEGGVLHILRDREQIVK